MFRGTFTALVTPFRDGGIDISAFEQLIETQIAAGITGIVAIGTTGESPTLSHEEREQVIRVAVAKANKRSLVLAGTGSNSTEHAIAQTKLAEEAWSRRRPARRAVLQQAEPGRTLPPFQSDRRCHVAADHALQHPWTLWRGHRSGDRRAPGQRVPQHRVD